MNGQRSHKHQAGRRPKSGRSEGDTRASILAAARRIFARRGLVGASVREVAEAAQVNNAMIYYHFKDKEDLYRAVLSDSFSALSEIWNDPVFTGGATVRRKIERFIESYIRFQKGNEDLRRIMAMEFASSGDSTLICMRHFDDTYARLAGLFREGVRTGEIRKLDPFLTVASLTGIITHNFILQPMAEHVRGRRMELSPKKFGAFVSGLFFDGLAADRRKKRGLKIE